MSELYNKEILRWSTRLTAEKSLPNPHAHARKTSRICGSRLTVDARFDKGVIAEFAQEVKACALGQASAAIVAAGVKGLDETGFMELKTRFEHMLDTGEANFPDAWADLAILAPVHEHPARRGSVMLPFDCLQDVFSQQEKLGLSA